MQTTPHAEKVMKAAGGVFVRQFMKCDQSISLGAQGQRVLKTQTRFQLRVFSIAIVPLFARDLTCPTSYALSNID
jgi:hypothetical protein